MVSLTRNEGTSGFNPGFSEDIANGWKGIKKEVYVDKGWEKSRITQVILARIIGSITTRLHSAILLKNGLVAIDLNGLHNELLYTLDSIFPEVFTRI